MVGQNFFCSRTKNLTTKRCDQKFLHADVLKFEGTLLKPSFKFEQLFVLNLQENFSI